jgi:hypothetical protein
VVAVVPEGISPQSVTLASRLTLNRSDVFTCGTIDDYDRWARVTDDPGWSWDRMFPYFIKACIHPYPDQ